MQNGYVIGIDAGGTKVAYGLFDPAGERMDRIQHPTDICATGESFADTLIENIQNLLARNGREISELAGIGICMPSFILFDEGVILMTSAMPGIKQFPMRDYLESRLHIRVVLDNDSNAAALAEYRRGAGRGSRHLVYITAGTGLGSGIIIDGKLFRGSYGWAGECGHMLATPDEGLMCGCENRGCFMSYASGRSISARVRGQMTYCSTTMLTPETADGEHVLEAYYRDDPLAKEVIETTAHFLGVCAFNIYQMLNINRFVFGGGLTNFGGVLFDRVRTEFDKFNHIPLPVEFRIAELGGDTGLIGAAEFVRGE
ncbi:MAG: ROK family protein [Eubacteriales bacterium]|nr:ROK family protein [Eubacteriales bacterium]